MPEGTPPQAAVLPVWVIPRAMRDVIGGWRDGRLIIRTSAPPREGRANEAVRRVLAVHLAVPRSHVQVIGGRRRREKRVLVSGLSWDDLLRRLPS